MRRAAVRTVLIGAAVVGTVTAGAAAATAGTVRPAAEACAPAAYCFYEFRDFNRGTVGTELDYRGCDTPIRFPASFRDKASSWQNPSGHTVRVYDGAPGRGTLLWTEQPATFAGYVGATVDDRADYFTVAC